MFVILLLALVQAPTLRVQTDTLEAANVVGGRPHRAGTFIRAVARAGDHYVITATFESARGGASFDTLAVDAKTLRPLWQRVHFSTDSASVRYRGNRVTGFSQQAGRTRRVIDRALPAGAMPPALIWHLVQSRDWAGSFTVREFDLWEDAVKTVIYRPLRKEKIRQRGRPVDVWVVEEDRGPTDVMKGARMVRLSWIDAARQRLVMRRDRPFTAAKNDGYLLIAR